MQSFIDTNSQSIDTFEFNILWNFVSILYQVKEIFHSRQKIIRLFWYIAWNAKGIESGNLSWDGIWKTDAREECLKRCGVVFIVWRLNIGLMFFILILFSFVVTCTFIFFHACCSVSYYPWHNCRIVENTAVVAFARNDPNSHCALPFSFIFLLFFCLPFSSLFLFVNDEGKIRNPYHVIPWGSGKFLSSMKGSKHFIGLLLLIVKWCDFCNIVD